MTTPKIKCYEVLVLCSKNNDGCNFVTDPLVDELVTKYSPEG